jgi:hypothetical protein
MTVELGQSPTIPPAAILAATAAIQPYPYSIAAAGCHSSFPPATFHASTVGKWATLLENIVCPSKATHHELRHPWSISKGAIRRVLHHGQVALTTPPWRRFPQEKKCQWVRSPSMNILLLFCSFLERRMIS